MADPSAPSFPQPVFERIRVTCMSIPPASNTYVFQYFRNDHASKPKIPSSDNPIKQSIDDMKRPNPSLADRGFRAPNCSPLSNESSIRYHNLSLDTAGSSCHVLPSPRSSTWRFPSALIPMMREPTFGWAS